MTVQITTERLELRVMELEDTLSLMTKALRNMNQMVGTLNEIVGVHTRLLVGMVGGESSPPPERGAE